MPNLNLALDPSLKPPSDLEAKLLRQIVLSGMPDQVNKTNKLIFKAFLCQMKFKETRIEPCLN